MRAGAQIVVTGASGFIGSHLLAALRGRARVLAIDNRSAAEAEVPAWDHVTWIAADVGDRDQVEDAFAEVRRLGGADVVVHLAAFYEFSGEEYPEYWRTNVEGLGNVLQQCRTLPALRRFVFASSLAACRFPPAGGVLTEDSAPDGDHVYARTKAHGEALVRDAAQWFPVCIVRLAALYSDWCEYPPLYHFLDTWLSGAWNRRILGGRGRSAVPYLHVKDAMRFFAHVLDRADTLERTEVLLASGDGATSHQALFDAATRYWFGETVRAWHVPRPLCRPGMWALDVAGRVVGRRPFERPWMADYVDLALTVDAGRTHARLGWAPRPRLDVVRRLPFLLERRKTDPHGWSHRNEMVEKPVEIRANLRLYRVLRRHEEDVYREFTERLLAPEAAARFPSYQQLSPDAHLWRHRHVLRHVLNGVRTRERGLLLGYCDDMAAERRAEGFTAAEVVGALQLLGEICTQIVREDPEGAGLEEALHDDLLLPLRLGVDQVEERFEDEDERAGAAAGPPGGGPPPPDT
jgi:nucleoside-diphosphate-sugar epimerase